MADEPTDIVIREDIVYATHDGVALKATLFAPKGDGPFPGVLTVPGGAWRICDRAGHRQWGVHLARHGKAALTIEYRVTGGKNKMFPQAAHDVIAGLQFIKGAARDLKIDPARIGVLATSAGAHLAALAVLAGDGATFKGAYSNDPYATMDTNVKAMALVYGVYDMFTHWQADLTANPAPGTDLTETFLGCQPFENQKLYFDASPIRHLSAAKSKIPLLIAWGTEDYLVDSKHQSETFMAAARQAGHMVHAYAVQGAAHFWMNEPIDDPTSYAAYLAPRLMRYFAQL